jgi:hypothetical protein
MNRKVVPVGTRIRMLCDVWNAALSDPELCFKGDEGVITHYDEDAEYPYSVQVECLDFAVKRGQFAVVQQGEAAKGRPVGTRSTLTAKGRVLERKRRRK